MIKPPTEWTEETLKAAMRDWLGSPRDQIERIEEWQDRVARYMGCAIVPVEGLGPDEAYIVPNLARKPLETKAEHDRRRFEGAVRIVGIQRPEQ